ncbi:MAG: hypothetical protein PVH85_08945 [Desulfobacterales bacterium]|jgi:hypothetical protein
MKKIGGDLVTKLFHAEALEPTICHLKALQSNVSIVDRGLGKEFFREEFVQVRIIIWGEIDRI